MALRIGFKVPRTVLSSSKKDIVNFIEQGPSIIKPLRSGRISRQGVNHLIYTNRVDVSMLNSEYDLTPVIFQSEIKKKFEIRVTVINDLVFAAKVASQEDAETSLDWRRKNLKFEPYKLDTEISAKCVRLVKELGLMFGAIDLIFTDDNEYFFLEINPNGQWVWIELDTGLSISEALINLFYK